MSPVEGVVHAGDEVTGVGEVIEQLRVDDLEVSVLDSEEHLGRAAAQQAAEVLREAVSARGRARVMFATGNSQLVFVRALREESGIPWKAITAFHMDEYVGMDADHPASFRRWIRSNIQEPLRPAAVHYIGGDADDVEAEAVRYEELVRSGPLDLVCMGIGENGHLAFNEPYQAEFEDPRWVRLIALEEGSRRQQVGEGHFPNLDAVPTHAITVTIPALLAAGAVVVSVPERRKAKAVLSTLTAPVSSACPSTVLRRQSHARLFLDRESAGLVARTSTG